MRRGHPWMFSKGTCRLQQKKRKTNRRQGVAAAMWTQEEGRLGVRKEGGGGRRKEEEGAIAIKLRHVQSELAGCPTLCTFYVSKDTFVASFSYV